MQNGPIYQSKDCMKYFKKCQYHDLCMSGCDERVIRVQYDVESWDPSHGLEEKAKGNQLKLFKKKKDSSQYGTQEASSMVDDVELFKKIYDDIQKEIFVRKNLSK